MKTTYWKSIIFFLKSLNNYNFNYKNVPCGLLFEWIFSSKGIKADCDHVIFRTEKYQNKTSINIWVIFRFEVIFISIFISVEVLEYLGIIMILPQC